MKKEPPEGHPNSSRQLVVKDIIEVEVVLVMNELVSYVILLN